MGDTIELGYQAALVSMHSPSYGRLWLSVQTHPGDKIACGQLQQMVQAVEAATGVRPRRRTELVRDKLADLEQGCQQAQARMQEAQQQLHQLEAKRAGVVDQVQSWQQQLKQLAAEYKRRRRIERPHSALATARRKVKLYQTRLERRNQELVQAQQRLERRQSQYQHSLKAVSDMLDHLRRLETDNAANPSPVRIIFRLDAGFGTTANVDWLIEMGYEVLTKPFSHWVTENLKRDLCENTLWQPVGTNADMTAWPDRTLANYRYPLNVALARYHLGDTLRYSAFLHYGSDPLPDDLPSWFQTYNGRQTIEAGIKEGKGVFQVHHLKVRSLPALFLQECLATFAANFVRWAAHWLSQQAQPADIQPVPLQSETRVKHLVRIAAHTSAWVFWQELGCLLTFTAQSIYAGQSLLLGPCSFFQPPLPFFKSSIFY